jgi:DNA-binding beta-propeller fold protein YncE
MGVGRVGVGPGAAPAATWRERRCTGECVCGRHREQSYEKFTSSGTLVWVRYVQETPLDPSVFLSPPSFYGVALDARGFIYVTDTSNALVVKLTPLGEVVAEWGFRSTKLGQYMTPEGVAVSRSGAVYVADTGNHRVLVFASSGRLIGSIRAGLDAPTGVLFSQGSGATGVLYVADSARGDIEQFSVAF